MSTSTITMIVLPETIIFKLLNKTIYTIIIRLSKVFTWWIIENEIIIFTRAMENCIILFSAIILWCEYRLLLDKNYCWKYYGVINVIKLLNGTCSNAYYYNNNKFLFKVNILKWWFASKIRIWLRNVIPRT